MTAARASVVEVSSCELRRLAEKGNAEVGGPHEIERDLNILMHLESFGDDGQVRIGGAYLRESGKGVKCDEPGREGAGRTLLPPLQPSPLP